MVCLLAFWNFHVVRLLAFWFFRVVCLLAFWMIRMVVPFGLRCVCLRFTFFNVVRLLAFLPLVCDWGTLFFEKTNEILNICW